MPDFKLNPLRNPKGSMTETAIVMILLIFLFVGLFDFVRFLNLSSALNQAAEEAIRLSSLPNNARTPGGVLINSEYIKERVIEYIQGAGFPITSGQSQIATYDNATALPADPYDVSLPKLRIYIVGTGDTQTQNTLVRIWFPFEFTMLKVFESPAGTPSAIGREESFRPKPFTKSKKPWTIWLSASRTRSNE